MDMLLKKLEENHKDLLHLKFKLFDRNHIKATPELMEEINCLLNDSNKLIDKLKPDYDWIIPK